MVEEKPTVTFVLSLLGGIFILIGAIFLLVLAAPFLLALVPETEIEAPTGFFWFTYSGQHYRTEIFFPRILLLEKSNLFFKKIQEYKRLVESCFSKKEKVT